MMKTAVVAGTGFSGRAKIIRRYCQENEPVYLKRDFYNQHDEHAIGVYITAPRLFGLLGNGKRQIGYIKSATAKQLCKRINKGEIVKGKVRYVLAPPDRLHPKVTIEIIFEH